MTDEGFVNPQELIARIGIREGMRIADFGCGSGEIAIAMAQVVGESGSIAAIDVLPSALELVSAKAKAANLEMVVPIRANLEVPGGSGLPDSSQDAVFMANILWQSSKKYEILQEAVRVLKSGGTLVAIEWNDASPAGPPAGMRITADALQQLAASTGLQFSETIPAGGFHYCLKATKL